MSVPVATSKTWGTAGIATQTSRFSFLQQLKRLRFRKSMPFKLPNLHNP